MFCRFLFISLCFFFIAGNALSAGSDVFVVHKGINLSSWLANAPRQPLYDRDFVQIKQAGFDNVRLAVDPEQLGFKLEPTPGVAANPDFLPVDKAITLAIDNGLSIVLDIHPSDTFMKTLQDEPWAEQEFTDLWIALAKRYRHYPAGVLAFGVVNEPQYYGSEKKYNAWVGRLVGAIRHEDSKRFIIVGGARGSSIEGLQLLQPLSDPRIIYDFHFYEPYMITHQGYHLGFEKKMLRYFHDVPYPSDRVNHDAKFYAPSVPNPSQAQDELTEYTYAKWNKQHISYRLQRVREWAAANKVRVICGEFGVLRSHIDPESRYRWIADTRKALEGAGIGWELWDYTDGFGIAKLIGQTRTDPVDGSVRLVDAKKGSRIIEPEALTALGLKQ